MTAVRESACEVLVADPVGDVLPEDHRRQRDIARVDALGDDEDVRHDVPVLAGEPFAGAAEAGDHLVADEENSVAVADLADRLEVAIGGNDDPVRPDDGFEDDRCNLVGPSY
jgi:hypothetical protein